MIRSIQQVQLRENLKSYDTALAALKACKEYGAEGIELNRYMLHPLPATIRFFTKMMGMPMGQGGNLDWPKLIRESGLQVISLHTDLGTLEKSTEEVLEEAKSYGTDKIVITGMFHYDYSEIGEVDSLIERLNTMGQKLREKGFELLYHNHNCEFIRLNNGQIAYERIVENTIEGAVGFEVDSYWMSESGADVLYWMKKLGKRMRLYHINDRGNSKKGKTASIVKADMLELGSGNMNLAAYLKQAKENGCDAVVLEQQNHWIHKDALQSAKISLDYLKKNM